MKCYYEVLDIDREADDATIKSAYKKLALRWHPDKNLQDSETAKTQFQLVQQAYEVLSDRQERAWYDKHREQLLHGSNKDYEDNCLELFQYFTASCYSGFDDDDRGFYSVYRHVFDAIAKEDMEHMDKKEEFLNIPMFGHKNSDYELVVRPFYNYWISYSTKRSYVWLDPYDLREANHRKVAKLIEKENKKIRTKAKRERNEQVRMLVAFVRKRDKRVLANARLMEQKAKENQMKAEEMARNTRRERLAETKTAVQGEWSKFDNVKDELEMIEQELAQEFDDRESDGDDLYCVACNKVFKTPKAFENHESSKKHRDNVDQLKTQMLDDDDEEEKSAEDDDIERFSQEDCDETKKRKTKSKKSKALQSHVSETELDDDIVETVEISCDDETLSQCKSKKVKRRKEKSKTDKVSNDSNETRINDTDHTCVTCKSVFSSKNKLFGHLKKTNHGVRIEKSENISISVKGKRIKRDERKRELS